MDPIESWEEVDDIYKESTFSHLIGTVCWISCTISVGVAGRFKITLLNILANHLPRKKVLKLNISVDFNKYTSYLCRNNSHSTENKSQIQYSPPENEIYD